MKNRRLRIAENWAIAEGYVAQIQEKRDDNGFLFVTRAYTYKVADERYGRRESLHDEAAAQFVAEAGHEEEYCNAPLTHCFSRRDRGGTTQMGYPIWALWRMSYPAENAPDAT